MMSFYHTPPLSGDASQEGKHASRLGSISQCVTALRFSANLLLLVWQLPLHRQILLMSWTNSMLRRCGNLCKNCISTGLEKCLISQEAKCKQAKFPTTYYVFYVQKDRISSKYHNYPELSFSKSMFHPSVLASNPLRRLSICWEYDCFQNELNSSPKYMQS